MRAAIQFKLQTRVRLSINETVTFSSACVFNFVMSATGIVLSIGRYIP